jgi:dihydrofolate reductase
VLAANGRRPRRCVAGREKDSRPGFDQGGWSVPYGDEDFGRFVTEVFDRAGAFLLGRRTYDILASYRPKVTDPADLVKEVTALKERTDGELRAHGSGRPGRPPPRPGRCTC